MRSSPVQWPSSSCPTLGARGGRAVVVLLALAVALARVYLGAHNPLDVVGGIAVGVVVGSLINLAVGVPARTARTRRDRPAPCGPLSTTAPGFVVPRAEHESAMIAP